MPFFNAPDGAILSYELEQLPHDGEPCVEAAISERPSTFVEPNEVISQFRRHHRADNSRVARIANQFAEWSRTFHVVNQPIVAAQFRQLVLERIELVHSFRNIEQPLLSVSVAATKARCSSTNILTLKEHWLVQKHFGLQR